MSTGEQGILRIYLGFVAFYTHHDAIQTSFLHFTKPTDKTTWFSDKLEPILVVIQQIAWDHKVIF